MLRQAALSQFAGGSPLSVSANASGTFNYNSKKYSLSPSVFTQCLLVFSIPSLIMISFEKTEELHVRLIKKPCFVWYFEERL